MAPWYILVELGELNCERILGTPGQSKVYRHCVSMGLDNVSDATDLMKRLRS